VEKGKLADLVLWSPAFFGVKPECIIKGGSIVAAPMGDPNASIPTPQPVHYQADVRSLRQGADGLLGVFSSKAGGGFRLARKLASARSFYAVPEYPLGGLSKKSMIHNGATPKIEVDPKPMRCAPTANS